MVPVLRRRKMAVVRGSVAPVPTVSAEQVAELKERYTFRREGEVLQYLRRYPSVVEVLMEARDVVRQFFGEGTHLVLEVITDYEDRTWQDLWILIYTDLESNQARVVLHEFFRKWWFEADKKAGYKLLIDLGYGHV